jgi:3-keto-disaccharide hydrolase
MTLTTTVRWGRLGHAWMLLAACVAVCCGCKSVAPGKAGAEPAQGFTPLFNGQDLTGWRGGETFDHRKLLAMPADQREAQIAKWTASMKAHWHVEKSQVVSDGPTQGAGASLLVDWHSTSAELVNDGQGAYATTEKDYGDFELLLEYKTVPRADSGIYLRGCPQVQIWDYTEKEKFPLGSNKGSGGLWNNSPGAPGKDPLVLADKPFGQWNKVRVLMVGARVSVWLNGKLVVNHALLENYYDRKTPVPPKGPIELQTHGGEIRWRNLFIREIGSDEADRILASHGGAGFKSIFNGRDFTGWAGPTNNYEVVNGAIQCRPHKGGTIYTTDDYSDFMARLEFKLPPGGNNGLAIRYPGQGDTAYGGMCELQVLDDNYEKATGEKIDPRQAHGSAYGMVAAARGYQHPIGEWNFEEVTVKGSKLKVELNGTVILDCDLSTVKEFLANHPHPGKDRTTGSFGFAGHNDPVAFRNIQIKPL